MRYPFRKKTIVVFTALFILVSLGLTLSLYLPPSNKKIYAGIDLEKHASIAKDQQFLDLMKSFTLGLDDIQMPFLQLDYRRNIPRGRSSKAVAGHQQFFDQIKSEIDQIDPLTLSPELRLDYHIISFETALNLEYLALESQLPEKLIITNDGLFNLPDGPSWYKYFVKRWTSSNITPEEVLAYGESEIERVKSEIRAIKQQSGQSDFEFFINSDQFLTRDVEEIRTGFEEMKQTVDEHLIKVFPEHHKLPDIKIERGTNPSLANVPGFYSNNTFYFNLFTEPFNKRQMDWLFIHEANPGHHFQITYANTLDLPAYRSYFNYAGYSEGWAAYVENLGQEVGLYKTPYAYLGKWEWDLIRSTRLVLDVGINYYGWDDEKALAYWRKHIRGKDEIGWREIKRMRKWPAQVLTYKIGARQIKELKQEWVDGGKISLKSFHTFLLNKGSVPVEAVPYLFAQAVQ
ncbi:MAG: DUF885 domain-containing protein [Bacteroidota bacterium]